MPCMYVCMYVRTFVYVSVYHSLTYLNHTHPNSCTLKGQKIGDIMVIQ